MIVFRRFFKNILLSILVFTGTTSLSFSQDEVYDFDELSVFLSIPRVGSAEVPAAIKNSEAYLSVTDLFNYLKIKIDYTPGFDEVTGFIVSPDAQYKILRPQNKIIYQKKEYQLTPEDFIRTESSLYIRAKVFGDVFGLGMSFNFRSLSVTLNTQVELPIIREIRLEEMRKNISKIQDDVTPDTTYRMKRSLIHAGNFDWNVNSNQQIGGNVSTRFNVRAGTQLLGGEANFTLNFDTDNPFDLRQQDYLWRYANNNNKVIRQLTLGRVSSSGKVSLGAPLVGAHITNAPTTYRRSFGTYILSDMTEPGWMVELYVNNILVNYMQADASGFFSFEVPLVYGETNVKLQFYGPYGEERSEDRILSIPFNFLPKGTLEYNLTAGVTEDSLMAKYARADINYGFGRSLSGGAGVEFYSALSENKFMPYVRSSLKILPEMLLNAEYVYKVKFESVLSYRIAKNLNIELNYLKYNKDQKAFPTSTLEERKVSLALPIRGKSFSMFARVAAMQLILPNANTFATEMVLSAGFRSFSANLSTQARFFTGSSPFVYSALSMAFRLPAGFIVTPQTQFNYTSGSFVNAKVSVDKQFSRIGYANLSYEQNFSSKTSNIELGMRFELSFARFSVNARKSGKNYSFSESAGGGVIVDAKNKYVAFRNRGSVGRGGAIIIPFLDINCNGVMDEGESAISGISARVSGGISQFDEKSSTIRVTDLEPYTIYNIEVSASSTENISWQIPFKVIGVEAEPNKMKRVEIPVFPLGEASGMVNIKRGKSTEQGLGRIIVKFFTKDGNMIKSVLSEPDGYYSFLGLKPGEYYASLDSVQIGKLEMDVSEMTIPFTIQPSYDGDLVGGLDFTLLKEEVADPQPATQPVTQPATQPVTKPTPQQAPQAVPQQVVPQPAPKPAQTGGFRVQIYAFNVPMRDKEVLAKIMRFVPDLKIEEIKYPDGVYRYVSQSFANRAEAQKIIGSLRRIGYKDTFIRED
mgnify:CR=1 FL=1